MRLEGDIVVIAETLEEIRALELAFRSCQPSDVMLSSMVGVEMRVEWPSAERVEARVTMRQARIVGSPVSVLLVPETPAPTVVRGRVPTCPACGRTDDDPGDCVWCR